MGAVAVAGNGKHQTSEEFYINGMQMYGIKFKQNRTQIGKSQNDDLKKDIHDEQFQSDINISLYAQNISTDYHNQQFELNSNENNTNISNKNQHIQHNSDIISQLLIWKIASEMEIIDAMDAVTDKNNINDIYEYLSNENDKKNNEKITSKYNLEHRNNSNATNAILSDEKQITIDDNIIDQNNNNPYDSENNTPTVNDTPIANGKLKQSIFYQFDAEKKCTYEDTNNQKHILKNGNEKDDDNKEINDRHYNSNASDEDIVTVSKKAKKIKIGKIKHKWNDKNEKETYSLSSPKTIKLKEDNSWMIKKIKQERKSHAQTDSLQYLALNKIVSNRVQRFTPIDENDDSLKFTLGLNDIESNSLSEKYK